MGKDYVPTSDNAKLTWADNLKNKLPAYTTTLGLTAAEVTSYQNLCKGITDAITSKAAAQANAKKVNQESDLAIGNSVKQLRSGIQGWKQQPGYTDAIGADLQLLGSGSSFDAATYKTTLTASAYPGRVEIAFAKNGVEGINIYTRLKGQPGWLKLSFDAHSPYVDNRPLAIANTPEHREFMAIGVINDSEVGLSSDIVEVVYGG